MRVGIVDADYLDKSRKHRFPNLALMKKSAYFKSFGYHTELVESWDDINEYDHVVISKVFSETYVPGFAIDMILSGEAECGGTGFFYAEADCLPYEVEHLFPDYHLYDNANIRNSDRNFYDNYSIGFLTRGCFRKCGFCVNKNYSKAYAASPLSEFHDESRKKLCFLDDNFLAYSGWRGLLEGVIETGKKYRFAQGLDERLITDESAKILFESNYDGTPHFAFDDWNDREIISKKAEIIRNHTDKIPIFYVLCGYDKFGKYDSDFWKRDMYETFARIDLLRSYRFVPYIMRFDKYNESPCRGVYVSLARWCNQPSFFKKMSFEEFSLNPGNAKSAKKYFEDFASSNYFVPNDFVTNKWE